MLSTIKNWINWPGKGINNGTELVSWAKNNWLLIVVIFLGLMIAYWIIKKIIGLVMSMFRD